MIPMLALPMSGDVAATAADLWSIQQDLAFVVSCCDEMLARGGPDDATPGPIDRALWEAATIAYARSFGSGRGYLVKGRARLKLPLDLVEELQGAQLHQQVMETRDQHIAHRVNDAEQARVLAVLAAPPAPKAVEGVIVWGARLVGQSPEHARELRDLATALVKVVSEDLTALQQQLIEWAKQQNLDDAYSRAKPMG
jgi:hypothetical protein